jgi:ferrous iron transport protein B
LQGGCELRDFTIALAGNPNAGKSTIFNLLTGGRQHIGNYPGVTVEKKEGHFRYADGDVRVVDLPGTYSLTAQSLDERVARDYIIDQHPSVVVDVVDTSNLERHLYLAVQLMELGTPLILVLNKRDLAASMGIKVDTDRLSVLLGVRIVETVASGGKGLDELKNAVIEVGRDSAPPKPVMVSYGQEIEAEIAALLPLAEPLAARHRSHDPRWLVVKLLENDVELFRAASEAGDSTQPLLLAVHAAAGRIKTHFGDSAETVIPDRRYGFISGACQEAVQSTVEWRHTVSDRIDEFVTSRVLGVPIFLLMMYLLFKVTFALGGPPMAWLGAGFDWLARAVETGWPAGAPDALKSLLAEGVIAGVGGVLMFLPVIAFLFAAIAFLEDSGYMARGAFIMDRFMHRIGLHGRSFIPMMIGFGCTVPAILATRSLESRRARLTTMLVLPLISCGARFPIYALFIAAFYPPHWRARMLMLIYLIGIVMAALLAKLLRGTVLRGEAASLVMELPPYRLPTVRGILRHTWERSSLFLRKAATIILAASVVLWVLTHYPKPPVERVAGLTPPEAAGYALSHSFAGRIGQALEPVMKPVGFDWQTTTALIGAFAAKEIFVAQLGIVYSQGEGGGGTESLQAVLRRNYSGLQAFCIMLFCLITTPCVATIATTRAESGQWRWAALQFSGLALLAYAVTFAVYQTGLLVAKWL